jgi:nucleotide-binding universal stress UspA family protein
MALVVPFDGSDLSKAALVRATQFETVLDENPLVVSVIPKNNTKYATEKGWIDATEPFDTDAIVSFLENEVTELSPNAEFHPLFVGKYSPRGTIASRIRKFANNNDATILFVGSENAGRVRSALTIGQTITSGRGYDTLIVSNKIPRKIEKLEQELPAEEVLS